jgi:hypothetical protein
MDEDWRRFFEINVGRIMGNLTDLVLAEWVSWIFKAVRRSIAEVLCRSFP